MAVRRLAVILFAGFLLCGPGLRAMQAQGGPVAYLVAPSTSTRLEARRLMRICRWADTTVVRGADILLAVVRSSGSDPLAPSYDSLKWLMDAATSQLNESGAQFHVYVFTIRPDLSFLQSSHASYDVNENGALTSAGAPLSPYPSRVLYPCW